MKISKIELIKDLGRYYRDSVAAICRRDGRFTDKLLDIFILLFLWPSVLFLCVLSIILFIVTFPWCIAISIGIVASLVVVTYVLDQKYYKNHKDNLPDKK